MNDAHLTQTQTNRVLSLRLRDVVYNPQAVLYSVPANVTARIVEVAKARQAPKDHNPLARDKRISLIGNVDAHISGLMGEWAASQWLKVPVDTRPMLAGNTRFDFIWRGLTVEVKTRRGMLALQGEWEFVSRILILATFDKSRPSIVCLQGWTTLQSFRKHFFKNDFGYGEQMTMQPVDLYAMPRLEAYANWMNLNGGV
jgi:hypothetical protein